MTDLNKMMDEKMDRGFRSAILNKIGYKGDFNQFPLYTSYLEEKGLEDCASSFDNYKALIEELSSKF